VISESDTSQRSTALLRQSCPTVTRLRLGYSMQVADELGGNDLSGAVKEELGEVVGRASWLVECNGRRDLNYSQA